MTRPGMRSSTGRVSRSLSMTIENPADEDLATVVDRLLIKLSQEG